MRTAIIIAAVILGIVIISFLVLSYALLLYVIKPRRDTLDTTKEREQAKGFWGNYEKSGKREFNIPTEKGYLLHGILMENDSDQYVIVSHGYTANRWASVKYANLYYELGYNVYLYDLRYHGQNKKTYCSMGQWESSDILAITKYLKQTFGEDISIGLHGESLGAASSILALGGDTSYRFCVADCGFADLGLLLEDLSWQSLHLPARLSHFASFACKLRYGYRLDRIRPVDAFKQNHSTPILLIHGKDDDFILPKHCQMFYEAATGQKEIHYFEHAKHAESYESDPKKYQEIITTFVKNL